MICTITGVRIKLTGRQQDGFHPPADAWRVRIFGSARIQRFALVQYAVCQRGCFYENR